MSVDTVNIAKAIVAIILQRKRVLANTCHGFGKTVCFLGILTRGALCYTWYIEPTKVVAGCVRPLLRLVLLFGVLGLFDVLG